MAACMAAMTFAACIEAPANPDNGGGDNGGDDGGVSGKRVKSELITDADGKTQKGDYTYNNDGMLVRIDWKYSWTSAKIYDVFTNNSDGTTAKWENYNEYGNQVLTYSYDSNKKPIKATGTITNSEGTVPVTYDITWQNGRQTRQVMKMRSGSSSITVTWDINYDSNGKRTFSTETHSTAGVRKYTRTYNSDGTVQKVIVDSYSKYTGTGFTQAFTWESGKIAVNYLDDYYQY